MLPQANQPAGVQRVCACLSVFFHFGDMKGAARIYIYTPRTCLIYIQSRAARPARRYFTSLIFYISLISMLIMGPVCEKRVSFGARALIISLFKRAPTI